jgi:hypothetical protein
MKEVKPSLFSDDMIIYVENPKAYTKQLLKWISKFKNMARYKNNI